MGEREVETDRGGKAGIWLRGEGLGERRVNGMLEWK